MVLQADSRNARGSPLRGRESGHRTQAIAQVSEVEVGLHYLERRRGRRRRNSPKGWHRRLSAGGLRRVPGSGADRWCPMTAAVTQESCIPHRR